MNKLNLLGERFGRLLVIEEAEYKKNNGKYWKCKCDCGNEKKIRVHSLRSGLTQSCGCLKSDLARKRTGVNHWGWKGGRSEIKTGYVYIHNPQHPNSGLSGRLPEHVFVMSESLGRPLQKGECVHHINGVRNDNRIENLELWTKVQPPGQRVKDKVQYAIDIIRLYKPEILKAGCGE
jgi:hypothetical protein